MKKTELWVSSVDVHSEMGASYDSADGCLQRRKSTKKAQQQVKDFSSHKYNSHRRVPETVAQVFDK